MNSIKKSTLLAVSLMFVSFGPPNCNLFEGPCYEACKEAEHAVMHGQGSKESQIHFDVSIEKCPDFDYSYFEKAVPYAKRGDMGAWKLLIDKAVELNPVEYLSQRGWYHFFFMHNYKAAIKDIELLDEMSDGDIGVTGDAMYHLNVLKALCYSELGNVELAIETLETQLNKEDHYQGLYDYIHLGVLYLKTKNYDFAIEAFEKQIDIYPISEAYFYRAMVLKANDKIYEYENSMKEAYDLYKHNEKMHNVYRQLIDEIYLSDIEEHMKVIDN